jgi:septum formation protein
MTKPAKPIILASASPRRKELLANIGLDFQVIPSTIEENPGEVFSYEKIEQVAREKAMDVAGKVDYPAIIIGSDTVVTIDDKILGKPADEDDAFNMLRLLSGRTHRVVSAIAVHDSETGESRTASVTSEVEFKKLTNREIRAYINTGDPFDKAGAYAIQGKAGTFVRAIKGCYSNIVGISVFKLAEMLREFGIEVL